MKPSPESPLNKIALVFALSLSLLLAAGLWAWLILPPAQAQGGDEELWRTLNTPFEHITGVQEDNEGDIWVVSYSGYMPTKYVTDTVTITETTQISETIQFVEGEGVARFSDGDWIVYTVENTNGGLPSNNIYSAFADSQGNLWFGTYRGEYSQGLGVTRFDGHTWRTFTVEDGLITGRINEIEEDDKGGIWVTNGHGLSYFEPDGQWESFTDAEVLGGTNVSDIYRTNDGAMWFAVSKWNKTGSCLTHYQDGKWYPCEIEGILFDEVGKVVIDRTGHWWVIDYTGMSFSSTKQPDSAALNTITIDLKGAIAYFDGKIWQEGGPEDSSLTDQVVRKMYQDRDGNLWFDTEGGLIWQDQSGWNVITNTRFSNTIDFLQDTTDNLFWFSTSEGLQYYTGYHRQRYDDVDQLLEASDGAIWTGTRVRGVSRYQDGEWQTFGMESGDLGHDYVTRLIETNKGAIWVGTWGGGVSRYQDGEWQTFSVESGDLSDNNVQDLFEANDGAIWVGTGGGGVSRYQDGEWQTFSVKTRDWSDINVTRLLEASDGTIWAGTMGNGVSRYQDGEWRIFSVESNDLSSNDVWQLLEASDGAIWAGTLGGGVSRYQGGKWQTFSVESGDLGGNHARYLLEASDGAIWVETANGGVSRYQDGEWQIFSEESGELISNELGYLREGTDKAIWVWFPGTGGRSRYQNGAWRYFTSKEFEVMAVEFVPPFSPSRGSLVDNEGFIWTITNNGLIRARLGNRPPWVHITILNNTPLMTTTSAITLAYDNRRRVSIGFEGDDLATRPEDLRYRYKLENSAGYNDWQIAIYNQPILFDKFDPGQYTLLIKAIDEDGNESEPAALDVIVEGPPEIVEVPVERRYTIPGLGAFTLPQLLGGGIGLAALLGLGGLGVVSWRKWQARRRDIEHNFNPFIGEGVVTEPDMFFGRQEILNDILQNIHATNFAIFGPKRIGKTSLLHQIDHRLSQIEEARFDYLPIVVSLHAVPESRFFRDLMRQIIVGLRAKGRYPAEGLPLQCQQSQPADEPYDGTTFNEDLITLRAALDAQSSLPLRLVLLVDEGDALNRYSQETLAHFREIFVVWAADYLRIVLTAEAKDSREWRLTGSPWFSIFGKQYQLTPFTPEEARQLIEKPVPHYLYQPEAIELILERSQLVPRHIQNICRQAVAEMLKEKTGKITLKHVETALTKVEGICLPGHACPVG